MKIIFHEGVREIGGSCVIVETKDARVALDYGIKLEDGISPQLPTDIDAVVITHAHLDHSGNLLTLADKNIVIIGSQPTRDITIELLQDLLKIQKLHGRPLPYTRRHLSKLAKQWLPRTRVALPGMKLTLHHAGHVLGAMMVEVTADEKTLLYTGDFCIHDTNILNGADLESLPKEPDALITESTYGDTIRPQRSELEHALLNEVHKTIMRKGNVLIPVFAFHRLQEMTERIETAMNEKTLPRYNAYYISNLGHKITRYYHQYQQYLNQQTRRQANPFTYSHLRRVFRTQQIKPPAIVICTSGFGHAGASHALLRQWAGHAQDAILVNTGYLPPDSPLFTAMKGSLEHEGTSIPVKATIEQISLSGHADQSELTTFIKNLKPQQTFLVHGTLDQTQPLASKIRPDTETHIPAKQDAWTI